jgi:hypothetical protein
MNALPGRFGAARPIGANVIVDLAEKIRSAGIHGTISIGTLRNFDALARGKTFGTRRYNGEAEKLISATGAAYNELYPVLSAMCDEIVREHNAQTKPLREIGASERPVLAEQSAARLEGIRNGATTPAKREWPKTVPRPVDKLS